jgi:hypothetical protein
MFFIKLLLTFINQSDKDILAQCTIVEDWPPYKWTTVTVTIVTVVQDLKQVHLIQHIPYTEIIIIICIFA